MMEGEVEVFYGVFSNKKEFCDKLKDYLDVDSDHIEILGVYNGFVVIKDNKKSYRVKLSSFWKYLGGGERYE